MTRRDFGATQQQLVERFLCDSARYLGLGDLPTEPGRQAGAFGPAMARRPCVDPRAPLCRCGAAFGA
ncbi:hypothetical protein [Thiococcus pfennigii]|jgi:hypothetical protein|uniref:hypothetical protein n=1 Tax=Thiococcus pfennigii TaxID=1057 RepID=UPI0019084E12|nr:hypothetical protein [Thiococcus pfennigii]